MKDPSGLRAWHLAKELANSVGEALPPQVEWRFPGLRSQLTKAALSVSANIAEGYARSSLRESARYLDIAISSLVEVENHLDVAHKRNMISTEARRTLMLRVVVLGRMLRALRTRILGQL